MPAGEQVFLSGAIGSNIVTLTTPYISIRKESFLMQVDCIGTQNPTRRSLVRFKRERAEAGVLLFDVMKSQKTKHGIAVKCERPRQSRHRHF